MKATELEILLRNLMVVVSVAAFAFSAIAFGVVIGESNPAPLSAAILSAFLSYVAARVAAAAHRGEL